MTPLATLDIDPFSPSFLRDPYPEHERLRQAGPVVWLDCHQIYACARYDEVRRALQDWRVFSSAAGVGLADFRKTAPFRPPSIVLEADPPLHDRTRPVLANVLSPHILETLRPRFEAAATELVDMLADRGRCDAVTDLAEVYPVTVFADAIGIAREGREHLLAYAAMVFNAFGPDNELFAASMQGAEPVRAWIATQCRRDALQPGSLGARVFEAADRGEVSEEEAGLLVRSLLSAGLDTTVYAIGNALWAFSLNPTAWDQLVRDPSIAKSAFDETLRFHSAVQTFFRTTTEPANLGGVKIPERSKVLLFLGAANRDPRRWEDPDRFDISRKAGGHLAFGAGIHGCVGQIIARFEGEIILRALARRVRRFEADGEPALRLNNTLRGLSSLPLTLHA